MAQYSILKPFNVNVEEKLMICSNAINFFSVMTNRKMCEILSIQCEPNKTYPLSDFNFLQYLKKTNIVSDPWRFFNPFLVY